MNYFQHWIYERHSIYLNRQAGLTPWTKDKILASYRFCNAYRQLDKVTKWLNEHWFPGVPTKFLPFWAVVARVLNDPEPLAAVRPKDWGVWCPEAFTARLESVKALGGTVRGAAYIVSTNGHTMPFPEYIATKLLNPLWAADLTPSSTLQQYAVRLQTFNGLGSFMTGQVIADLKYHHTAMKRARDWWTFVVPGPGSKRGLNRLHGRAHDAPMSDKLFYSLFPLAVKLADAVWFENDWEPMHAQDIQNCLCEFDKYERARLGQGRPKQRYG
jgi:hypothetical protein